MKMRIPKALASSYLLDSPILLHYPTIFVTLRLWGRWLRNISLGRDDYLALDALVGSYDLSSFVSRRGHIHAVMKKNNVTDLRILLRVVSSLRLSPNDFAELKAILEQCMHALCMLHLNLSHTAKSAALAWYRPYSSEYNVQSELRPRKFC